MRSETRLLVVTEGGEEIKATQGWRMLLAVLRGAGLEIGREVTVIPAGKSAEVEAALASLPDLRCVLLYGNEALRVVTGWDSAMDWHGSVMNRGDFRKPSPVCGTVAVIPCLSPFRHDPYRTYVGEMWRVTRLAVAVAQGLVVERPRPVVTKITGPDLFAWPGFSGRVVIDTEYGEDGVPYLIGFADAESPEHVLSLEQPWMWKEWVSGFLASKVREAVMHHAPADVGALRALGVEWPGSIRIIDTLQLHALLESSFPHRLSWVARTCIPGCVEWKWMRETENDEEKRWYNALDVMYTGIAARMLLEAADAENNGQLLRVYEEEVEPNILRMAEVERVGIRIDEEKRERLREALDAEAREAGEAVRAAVADALTGRVTTMLRIADELDARRARYEAEIAAKLVAGLTCGHEPDLAGRGSPRKCPVCAEAKAEWKRRISVYGKLKKNAIAVRARAGKLRESGFNPSSDDDLRWYVTSVLGATTGKRTDSGKVSVSVKALSNAARKFADDPVIAGVWRVRHARKLRSTFADVECDANGVTHPPVRMHGTATGRPASGTDRNGEEEKAGNELAYNAFNLPEDMRVIYVPDKGNVFISADFKDLEGRLVALFSGDETVCRLFAEGRDRHSFLAAKMYGCEEGEAKKLTRSVGGVSRTLRWLSKKIGHGISYGMTPPGVASNLQISLQDAMHGYNTFFDLFPGIRIYQNAILEHVFGHGDRGGARILHTVFGRRRRFNGLQDVMGNEALALPAQSGGASVWYRKVEALCERNSVRLRIGYGRFVIGTYDSFMIEVPAEKAEEAAKWLREVLEAPLPELASTPGAAFMSTSLPVDVKTGEDYSFGEGRRWVD